MTERVQIALSALTGHLSHRERQVSLIRHGCAVPPSPEGKACDADCDRRESPVIPGTDSELVGADALIGPMGNVLKLEWGCLVKCPYGSK